MEKYKIVLTSKNVGNAGFCIINTGECLYKDRIKMSRRDVGFVCQKDDKFGDAYEIEFIPEGTKYLQNPYCRKIKKIECNKMERLKNLQEACEIIISQTATTQSELFHPNNKYKNFYFMDGVYLLKVENSFDAFVKFFKNEKQNDYAKKIVDITKNMISNFYSNLDIGENEKLGKSGKDYDPIKFVSIVRKKHFSFLTPNQKVVSFIHETVKQKVSEYYLLIKDICKNYTNKN